MSSAIKDGLIQRLSPSMINAFDASTAFGCQRRWGYRYIEGKPEPSSVSQELGTALHALNEACLKGGDVVNPNIAAAWPLFIAGKPTLDTLKPSIRAVEKEVVLELAGIPMRGYCDLVTEEPGIWDWKTTSNIEQYGKTPGALARDTQMVLYAQAEHPSAPRVRLAHGQYQTKGRGIFRVASVEVSRAELDDHTGTVILPLVEQMKKAATAKEARELPANRNACRMCPHKGYCPSDKENPIMSFFSKYKTSSEPAAQPAPILPPDAPKSEPALAAKPVEGFNPVPPPKVEAPPEPVENTSAPAEAPVKRGPGRPPGSKNKPKHTFVDVVEPAPVNPPVGVTKIKPAVVTKASAPSPAPETVQFESVTVSYGVTVNLGINVRAVRIDVGMTAKVSGDASAAYQTVLDSVKAKVEAEVMKIKENSK